MQKSTRLFLLAALVLTLMAFSAYGVVLAAPGLNLDGLFDILGVSQVSASATPETEADVDEGDVEDVDDGDIDDVDDDQDENVDEGDVEDVDDGDVDDVNDDQDEAVDDEAVEDADDEQTEDGDD